MLKLLAKLFGSKKADTQPEAAPYKVEVAPVPAGTPLVNDAGKVVAIADGKPAPGPKATSVADKATEAAVKSVAKPAKKKAAPKKPAAAKKPRKPKSKPQV